MVKQLPTLLKTVEIFGIYGNDLDLHWALDWTKRD
jgi:hypothetical protein